MTLLPITDEFVLANRVEAGLWIAVAIGCVVAMRLRPRVRGDLLVAALAFALFGVSDLVETTTGAWWRPWWLLAWKAACVVVFGTLLARHVRRQRSGARP